MYTNSPKSGGYISSYLDAINRAAVPFIVKEMNEQKKVRQ
jgi:hypothetical protein